MYYDPRRNDHGLSHNPMTALVVPRPIGWISTVSRAGVVNLAPYSFFNLVSGTPPFVMFASKPRKDSQRNAEETGEFVCNMATYDLREVVNASSAEFGPAISEPERIGLEMAPCREVKPPRVTRSPVALECKYFKTVELVSSDGTRNASSVILGEVVGIHIDDSVIVNGHIDVTRMQPLARLGYMDLLRGERAVRHSAARGARPGSIGGRGAAGQGRLASTEAPMKLHWSPRSPFVRKVMVVAHDIGVADRIECVRTVAAMMKPHPDLMIDNPLSKIPTLVLDNGTVLYDSAVICEYLDHLHDGPKLFPLPFEERMTALRRQALGDGLLDALVLWRGELSRPAEQQSQPYLKSFSVRNEATLAALEREAPALESSAYSIGHVAIGCALCYLDFRFADRQWRRDHPQLARWHATFAARASVRATEPVDDA